MMRRFCSLVLILIFSAVFAGCGDKGGKSDKDLFVIGFSQVGSESDWRLANTRSMEQTFTESRGYELRMENAKQRQDNQLAAVRNFILEGVDLIIIAPTVEDGWETVLTEIKNAGIPVIILTTSATSVSVIVGRTSTSPSCHFLFSSCNSRSRAVCLSR